MKRQKLKLGLMALLLSTILFVGCDKGETIQDDASLEEIDLKTAETEAVIDEVSDETSVIIEEAYQTVETPTTKSTALERYIPDCVTITKVITQNMKTVTVDFGEGCELRNGNFVSGAIIMEYEKDPEAATKMISYSFRDFYFNRKHVEGGGSILRERMNDNGNPQSTKTFDVTVTWPDDSFAKKEGTKMREMIEGQGTKAWGDNVFLITGNWKFTKKNGTVLSATVTEPLRRELACKFLVSGVIELSKNENNALLNYGDGSCDDLATISINGGEEREIHLSNL
ncbi:hypothetical protein UMM65_10465 [Aureibaculum sp. 2210JD6-5]|uniref:hypothetical protein n=1 Tax=Aureibaculum sp. 2210JD6-5 TaxID=3103957 RepID=UPI002AACAFEC|nr:hypothetical protein [Aureibaculum sp. 2210JD6-5]MDY7395666.1 hypothetical protein [Aureibaculum sp. 2210JD6-5]